MGLLEVNSLVASPLCVLVTILLMVAGSQAVFSFEIDDSDKFQTILSVEAMPLAPNVVANHTFRQGNISHYIKHQTCEISYCATFKLLT